MWFVIAALIAALAFLLFREGKRWQRRTLSPLATIGLVIAALGILAGFLGVRSTLSTDQACRSLTIQDPTASLTGACRA